MLSKAAEQQNYNCIAQKKKDPPAVLRDASSKNEYEKTQKNK